MDRKRDPNTGEIYHPVLNPPNENDKKLMDRLEDVEVDMDEINMNNYRRDDLYDQFTNYYDQFFTILLLQDNYFLRFKINTSIWS